MTETFLVIIIVIAIVGVAVTLWGMYFEDKRKWGDNE